jgi:hypothetical protein
MTDQYVPAPLTRQSAEQIREATLAMGASRRDADAAAAEQQRRLDAHPQG